MYAMQRVLLRQTGWYRYPNSANPCRHLQFHEEKYNDSVKKMYLDTRVWTQER